MSICRESGYKAGEYYPDRVDEMVPFAGEKTVVCPYHKISHLDHSSNFRVTDQCVSPADMIHQFWFILPPALEYYYKVKHNDYKPLPPFMEGCADAGNNYVMDMIYPKNNAAIYIPLEFDGKRGKVVFTATHKNSSAQIY